MDLFRIGVFGRYLKLSMLKLFNRIKAEKCIPDCIKMADVVTIYKGNVTYKMTEDVSDHRIYK
jgi:hypothetical protein